MVALKDVKAALHVAGDFTPQELYPAPFPEDEPTISLEKISLCKLLNGDTAESERMFNVCSTVGFFYLDMLDHALGRQTWQQACHMYRLGRERLKQTPLDEKSQYKPLGGVSVFDRGYVSRTVDQSGLPNEREFFNIPQSEFFGTKVPDRGLPKWLSQDTDSSCFQSILSSGNKIARTVLSILEKQLQLPGGSFSKLHRLNDDSGDFLRILRYSGAPPVSADQASVQDGFPPHKDAVSVAILFTWLGGLQIPDRAAKVEGLNVKSEDWRWVRPEPGHAIVNLGDAMEIFTNKVLKSGIHRVVKAPGLQREHDRYSVLLTTRPKHDSLMKAMSSPLIPETQISENEHVMNSLEWGHNIISRIIKVESASGGPSNAAKA